MGNRDNYTYATIGTDRETIKHYGISTPCFDLHPHQIQPSHIVITSPWFNTREHNFGRSPKPREDQLVRRRERVLRLKAEGYTHTEIGVLMGIASSNVRQMITRWQK